MIDDTICAIASPPDGALRGIIRVSGSESLTIVSQCLREQDRTQLAAQPDPARSRRRAYRIESQLLLPAPLGAFPVAAMVWPTSRSYTGQPSVELHLAGALPVLSAAIETLVQAGARPARPGEFTLRGFLAGRFDLTQAEAVLGVIDAEDVGALQAALDQLAGGLGKPLQKIRAELLNLLADVEAGLDFVDEDIEFIRDEDLLDALRGVARPLATISDQLRDRDRSANVPLVVVRGKPNAGKSRLLNAICRRETAIVADQAGTTRDPVESLAQCGRHQVRLADTAGLEAGRSEIDREAQVLAEQLDRRADLRLFCIDLSQRRDRQEDDLRDFREAVQNGRHQAVPTLLVGTKQDLCQLPPPAAAAERWIRTSSLTGEGLAELSESIAQHLDRLDREETKGVAGTAARCRASLQQATRAISEAMAQIEAGGGHDLAAAEMRLALSALGEVTGEVYTDDILDRIFSRFCIGK